MTRLAKVSSSVETLQTAWRDGGMRLLAHRISGRWHRERNALRKRLRPLPLEAMINSPWSVSRSAGEALALVGIHRPDLDFDPAGIEEVLRDGRAQMQRILSTSNAIGKFSEAFDLETESSLLIYGLCRLTRPDVVVETGVARGLSTAMILSAISNEHVGHLHSFDVSQDVGALVPKALKERWTLWNLGGFANPARGLSEVMREIGECRIFLHDSDHSESHQRHEYLTAQKFLAPNGFLLSDDIEGNYAMQEACPTSWHLIALPDSRKVFGIAMGS